MKLVRSRKATKAHYLALKARTGRTTAVQTATVDPYIRVLPTELRLDCRPVNRFIYLILDESALRINVQIQTSATGHDHTSVLATSHPHNLLP
jgi:hypothetical protein